MLKEIKWNSIMISLVYVLLGLILIIFPDTTARTLCHVGGGAAIMLGVITVFTYMAREIHIRYYQNDFVVGLVEIVLGIFAVCKADLIISLLPFILGVFVMISGFIKLQKGLDMKSMEMPNWYMVLILAAVNILFGAVLLFNPFTVAKVMFIIIGAGLVFSGITDVITNIYLSRRVKEYMDHTAPVDTTANEISQGDSEK